MPAKKKPDNRYRVELNDPDNLSEQEVDWICRELKALMIAEQNQYTGAISRQELHRIADRIRARLNGTVSW